MRRGLRHQVKIQEFHQLQLHFPTRRPVFEQTRYCKQSIQVFKTAGDVRLVQERGDQGKHGRRLDGGAGRRVEEVEKEVHVDLAGEEGARGRVDEKDATKEVESRDEEEVVLAVTAFTEETLEAGD